MPSPNVNRNSYRSRVINSRPVASVEDQPTEFHETLAPAMPGQTYRSEVIAVSRPTTIEQIITLIAVVLNTLLAIRFVLALLSANLGNTFVSFVFNLTDWLVGPFRSVFHMPATSAGGYADWASLIAIVVVSLISSLVVGLLRAARST